MTVSFGTRAVRHGGDELRAVLCDPAGLVLAADHEAGDVLEEQQRDAALVAQLDEVRGLEGGLGEEDPVVGDDPDRVAVDVGEAGDDGRAVLGLELVEAAAVDDAGDDLARVVGGAAVGRDGAVEGRWVDRRGLGRGALPWRRTASSGSVATIERTIRSAWSSSSARWSTTPEVCACSVAAAELLGGHLLAGRRLHERRAAEEDRPLVADDHGLVAHRRDVGAAGRARAHHRGDLRDALAPTSSPG